MLGQDWRPDFSPAEVRRELEIIKADLQCNVVRICGQDLDRLTFAGEQALDPALSGRWSRSQRLHGDRHRCQHRWLPGAVGRAPGHL